MSSHRIKSGVKCEDVEIGYGEEAESNDSVLVEVIFFLNKGDEIDIFKGNTNHQYEINLKSRDFIPGLRYGIVGMREGGTRNLKISPHLAYGAEGVADRIPPNAVLHCKVKLLRIAKDRFPTRNIWKRQIIVAHKGEAARNLPRWSFGIVNNGDYGITVCYPIPGMTWRHTRNRKYSGELDEELTDLIFEEIRNFPRLFPNDVVDYNSVWADMSEPAGNTPREKSTNKSCINVLFFEEPNPYDAFYVTEDNQEFQTSKIYKLISGLLRKPELK